MDVLSDFINHFDWIKLVVLLVSMTATLLCLTVHELCHGAAAYFLGDRTAKQAGRLTLNPLAHIDPVGFVMMLIAHVGWAKAVPVDTRHFKKPKRDMAFTALAGPASNLLLTLFALTLGRLFVFGSLPVSDEVASWVVFFLSYVAVLSTGLGLFNLIPIPPLDGSKVLFAFLPDRLYDCYLRYERYLLLVVVALAWFGVFSGPLNVAISWVLRNLCELTGFPVVIMEIYFGL